MICAQSPGKGLVDRNDNLAAAGGYAQEFGSTTSRRQIENLPRIYPNELPDPDPDLANATSPEFRIVLSPNRVK